MTTSEIKNDLVVKLQPHDMSHLHSLPQGTLILDTIHSMQWDDLLTDSEACKKMTSSCILCGVYVGQCRELISHLKLYHADLMPNVMAKAAQLTLQFASTAPCRFCRRSFKTGHVCPVMLQASLLMVNGGGTDSQSGMKCVQRVLTCEICQEVFPDVSSIQAHLRQIHRLAQQDWNPSRDAVAGSNQCAHCGAEHISAGGLRRRITFGHCTEFDANRTSESLQIDETILQALRSGDLQTLLADTARRTSLTLHCHCCGETYTRRCDLTAHLQQCHGAIWKPASQQTHLLMDHFRSLIGCVCNPSVANCSVAHVCVGLRQLAMQFQRMADVILVPFSIIEDMLNHVICTTLEEGPRQILVQFLLQRKFDCLCTDETMTSLLRSVCVLCGEHFHPADLCKHLYEDHEGHKGFTHHYVPQLAGHLDISKSHICNACGLTFDMPSQLIPADRIQAAAAHLKAFCPVVQHCAVLLSCLGTTLSSHGAAIGRRCTGSAGGSLPEPRAPDDGHQPPPESGPPAKKAKRTRTRAANGAKGAGPKPAAAPSVNSGAPHGSRSTSAARAGFLRLFPHAGANGNPSSAASASKPMEENSHGPEGDTHATIAPEPHETCSPRVASQSGEASQDDANRSLAPDGPSTGMHPGGRRMAIHEMVPNSTEVGGCLPEAVDWPSHGEAVRSPDREPARSADGCEISLLETAGLHLQDNSLETAGIHMRNHDAHTILQTLAGNAVWHLIGATMKCHTLTQSKVCQSFQQALHPTQGKGKGKGKKGKST